MTDFRYRDRLEKHISDIKSICPLANEAFVCPICLTVIAKEYCTNDTVTKGHIWPKYIQTNLPKNVAGEYVLLCKNCNSMAGSNGDANMQEMDKIRRSIKSGVATFESRVTLVPLGETRDKLGDQAFELRGHVDFLEESFDLNLRITNTQDAFTHNTNLQRSQNLQVGQHYQITFEPAKVNWELGKIGWLTSAYLYAFNMFGYKYILQHDLDVVRHVILASFDSIVNIDLDYKDEKSIIFYYNEREYFNEPQMRRIIPLLDSEVPNHLIISIFDYNIRLPITLIDLPKRKVLEGELPHKAIGLSVFIDEDKVAELKDALGQISYKLEGGQLFDTN